MEKRNLEVRKAGYSQESKPWMNGDYIFHNVGGNILKEHINRYLGILKMPYEPKTSKDSFNYTGLLVRVNVFLSKDGDWLYHSFLGQRVLFRANYYRAICQRYLEDKHSNKLESEMKQNQEKQVA